MNLKKNAQLEIIGLVIIVFLLTLGMFFLVSTSNKDNADLNSINPQDAELSQNTIDAIKYVKVDCPPPFGRKVGIDDLIIDMASDQRIYCNSNSSEEYTKLVLSNILNSSLGAWSKAYYFVIIKNEGKGDEAELISMSNYNCTISPNSQGKLGEQPFPLRSGAGTVTMKLFVCK